MLKQVIAVVGMPRSGTSWLGQLFNSSPHVRFRMEPIFSYAFKDAVNEHSSAQQYKTFFEDIYNSDDSFMRQIDKSKSGEYPNFLKTPQPTHLVFKTTRYHHILRNMLQENNNLKIIAIVRHPCGAISSWLNTPSEFPADAVANDEWKTGQCRNLAVEEFWGFNDWKTVTSLHLELQKDFPENFKIIRYESLVNSTGSKVQEIFDFCVLELKKQTLLFLENTHRKNDDRPYSVYKSKSVTGKWQKLLPEEIIDQIFKELRDSELKQFLNTLQTDQ